MFKVGDEAYTVRFGIVTLEMGDAPLYPLRGGRQTFTRDGKADIDDKHPSLIPLGKAEKMGLVRKRVKPHKGLRVKYYDKSTDEYYIDHNLVYKSEEEFEFERPEFLLISFVDEKLNECPPPQETVEWEETVREKWLSIVL